MSIAEDDDIETQMIRFIERDVLDHFNNLLPIDGRDIIEIFNTSPGPEVGIALNLARQFWESGVRDRDQLLQRLYDEWESHGGRSIEVT